MARMLLYLAHSEALGVTMNSILRNILTIAVIVATLLLPPRAFAFYISWNLSTPTPKVTAGSSVDISFNYTLDLFNPPSNEYTYFETVSGVMPFGNGSSQPFNFTLGGNTGSRYSISVPFTSIYSIPGTYYIGGSPFQVRDNINCCTVYNRQFTVLKKAITVTDPATVALHTSRAAEAQELSDKFAKISVFTIAGIEDLVTTVLQEVFSYGGKWGEAISLAIGIIALLYGAAAGGLVSTLLASFFLIVGVYLSGTVAIETQLANDPPDSNYQQVYQYSNDPLNLNFGLGSSVNSYFQNGFSDLILLIESKQGELASTERAQGALLAGDMGAFATQAAAAQSFRNDYTQLANNASVFFEGLPSYLSSNGYDAGVPDINYAYTVFNDAAIQLRASSPSSQVPEPSTLILLASGFVGMGLAYRRRRQHACH
jgi:hypothetical protein